MLKKEIKRFLPPTTSTSPFRIEIDKTANGMSVSVSGVKRISEFSDNRIRLCLRALSVEAEGEKLSMSIFESRKVEIIGKITEVRFIYGKA